MRRDAEGARSWETQHEQSGGNLPAGLPRRTRGGAARRLAGAGPRRVGGRARRDHRDDPRGRRHPAGGHHALREGRGEADQDHHSVGRREHPLSASGHAAAAGPNAASLRDAAPAARLCWPGATPGPPCLPKPAKRPRGRQMMRYRAARSDPGSTAVELAVLAPALMMICMLILQFGLWFNARQTALAAAQAGAVVARREAAGEPGRWQADAQGTARQYYQRLNSKLLRQVNAATATAPGGNVYVTVSGQVAVSVFPFFGLHLGVSATAGGPVECFRPASQSGAC